MTECFELIDRKLLNGPWVMGEQYTTSWLWCDAHHWPGHLGSSEG